jgi:hypothetical protein
VLPRMASGWGFFYESSYVVFAFPFVHISFIWSVGGASFFCESSYVVFAFPFV